MLHFRRYFLSSSIKLSVPKENCFVISSNSSVLWWLTNVPDLPDAGVNHGNQKDLRLSILYKVEIVIIY